MIKEKILLVDDEPNVLAGYKRGLREHFPVEVAESGAKALERIEGGEVFAVIVSDMRMPGMDGITLLKNMRKAVPDTVRIMLTGNADQQTAMDAVNQGSIFRFLTKPCSNEDLVAAIAVSVRQHRLITAEKELLEKTLKGSIHVLTEILSLIDPESFRHSEVVRQHIADLAPTLGLENIWELEVAAMLAPIGVLTLPHELRTKMNAGKTLTTEEQSVFDEVPSISSRLLQNIPRLENVAALARFGGGRKWEAKSEFAPEDADIPNGGHTLRILFDLVEMESAGHLRDHAFAAMARRPERYNLDCLERARIALLGDGKGSSATTSSIEVKVKDMLVGDVLLKDVKTLDGRKLLSAGTRLSEPFLERLYNYRRLVGVREPISVVRVMAGDCASVPSPEPHLKA
jgi:CheY-like chemotaxis protein